MPAEVEQLILEQLREMRADLKMLRADLQMNALEVSALKAKLTAWSGFVGAGVAALVSWGSHLFF